MQLYRIQVDPCVSRIHFTICRGTFCVRPDRQPPHKTQEEGKVPGEMQRVGEVREGGLRLQTSHNRRETVTAEGDRTRSSALVHINDPGPEHTHYSHLDPADLRTGAVPQRARIRVSGPGSDVSGDVGGN